MSEILDQKYIIHARKAGTDYIISQDEAILFRAQDKALVPTLKAYKEECKKLGCSEDHLGGITALIDRVKIWQSKNLSRVKRPD